MLGHAGCRCVALARGLAATTNCEQVQVFCWALEAKIWYAQGMTRVRLPALVSIVVGLMLLLGVAPHPAWADAKSDIAAKVKDAMQNYDNLEYDIARKLLTEALAIAKRSKLDADPVVAKVHINLAVVYFAGLNQPESAKLEFLSAVQIDPKIQIDAAYRRADMAKMLDEARSEVGPDAGGGNGQGQAGGPPPPPAGGNAPAEPAVDCTSIAGLVHTVVETAPGGKALTLVAHLGDEVEAASMVLQYRAQGADDFTSVAMTKAGCTYRGVLPATALRGSVLHYYIAAQDAAGKTVMSSGSRGAPNLIEVTAPVAGADGEDPNSRPSAPSPGTQRAKKVFLAVGVASGVGAVTGNTEAADSKITCESPITVCFAPGLLTALPELGIYLSPRTSLSLVARLGWPVGANFPGHATMAPAGFVRLRRTFAANGAGLGFSAALGGGAIRNVVTIQDTAAGANKDTVAMGPLLVGAGLGYTTNPASTVRFFADVTATGAIPVVDTLGSAKMTFGVQFDLALGLAFGF